MHFSSPLHVERQKKLERAGAGERPFPQVREVSSKVLALGEWAFLGQRSGCISQWLLFPSPYHNPGGSFLAFYHQNLGFLEVKPTEVWTPLRLSTPRDSYSYVILPSASSDSSHLPFVCPYQLMALALLLQLDRSQL